MVCVVGKGPCKGSFWYGMALTLDGSDGYWNLHVVKFHRRKHTYT